MKFDAIVGNPPYQLETSGDSRQAVPIYDLFVNTAKLVEPHYLSMIMPSRWFAGGMGLDDFRNDMMHDHRIVKLVDYTNAKECFPQISISGGICYFLWDSKYDGMCNFISIRNGDVHSSNRALDEFPILVRYNEAISILHKIAAKKESRFDEIVSPLMPYGLPTNYRGKMEKDRADDLALYASDGVTYIHRDEVNKGTNSVDKYKILISKTGAEHAGEPGKDGMFKVLTSSMRIINPGEVCTHSYFVIWCV